MSTIEEHILIHLSESMPQFLSETDLRQLYFRLLIDWESLTSGGKNAKVIALLETIKQRKSLIPPLIMHLYKINPSVEWLQFPSQVLPEQIQQLEDVRRLVIHGDNKVSLKKLPDKSIAERLLLQIETLISQVQRSKVVPPSDLQDWSRDIQARLIEPDNTDTLLENYFPRPLHHHPIYKAGNPLPYPAAEDEVSSLVKKRMFWDRHPVFRQLLESQDGITAVYGEEGTGRTALCWGLYAYEPYHLANDFLIYVSQIDAPSCSLREHIAQNVWLYIAHKPTLLSKLSKEQLHLLAHRLAQVLGSEKMQDSLRQWLAEHPWLKQATVQNNRLVKREGQRCLVRLQNAVANLTTQSAFNPDDADWLRNIRQILLEMAFRFNKFRILLDYRATTHLPHTLRAQVTEWVSWDVNVVVFMSTSEYKRHFAQSARVISHELRWSPAQLHDLIYYRFGRQLRNHDGRRSIGGSDQLIDTLFASTEAKDRWLSSGQTPRELIIVWHKMLELYTGEPEVFTESLIAKAIKEARTLS